MIAFPFSFIKNASTLNEGLVIKLDANDASSYPGSGTTVFNLQSGSYNHTLSNSSYTVLNGIKCFDCNGASALISVTQGSGPTLPNTGYTYITWARIKTSSADYRTLFRTWPSDHPILVQVGNDNLGFWDNNTTAFADSGYDVTQIEDSWAQYTVVGDSSSSIFYINGVQVGTVSYGAGGNTHWAWGGLGGQPFGYVANMYYYDRKLSLSEITSQYNTLSPTFLNYVRSNLALYFDPNNPSSYVSGSTINDLSENSLNGSLSNTTYTTPSFDFNGSSSQISVADNSLLEPSTGDWTIEAWVNHTAVSGSSRVIIGKTDGGNAADWAYGLRTSSTGSTFLEVGNGSTSSTSPASTLSINTWYQVVGVFTNVASNSIALYINASFIGSNSHSFSSIKNTTSPLYIGSFNGGQFSQWLNGKVGIVRIYNKALSRAEIAQNFQNDASKYGLTYDAIRTQLTSAQQTTYDAASVGSWIKVTSTEYNNIVSIVTGATKKGNSDAQIATRDLLTSGTNPYTFGSGSTPSFQIDQGEYVIAMITEAWNSSSGQSQLGYTTTFKGTPISNIGPTAGPSQGGGRDYYVRKAPTDVATETRYPTLSMTQSPNAVNGWAGFVTSNGGTSWSTAPNGQVPKIQIVTTSTKSW